MKTFLAAAVATVLMILPYQANAEPFTSTGVIESVDAKAKTVRIRNGDAYRLPNGADLSRFSAGQRVHVKWHTQKPRTISEGGEHYFWLLDATAIERAD